MWDKVFGRVCWKSMSEIQVMCGEMRGCCNLAMEMAKIGVEIMQSCSQEVSQDCAKVS